MKNIWRRTVCSKVSIHLCYKITRKHMLFFNCVCGGCYIMYNTYWGTSKLERGRFGLYKDTNTWNSGIIDGRWLSSMPNHYIAQYCYVCWNLFYFIIWTNSIDIPSSWFGIYIDLHIIPRLFKHHSSSKYYPSSLNTR